MRSIVMHGDAGVNDVTSDGDAGFNVAGVELLMM